VGEVERPRVEDRELLLDGHREVRRLLESLAGGSEVEALVPSQSQRSGQVEVQRVEQVDGGARRMDGHLGGNVEELLGVVEDDPDAGFDAYDAALKDWYAEFLDRWFGPAAV